MACDSLGACQFPTDACGIAQCNPVSSVLSTSHCSGGSCRTDEPMPCPGGYACYGTRACWTTCLNDTECASGYYCLGKACHAQAGPGEVCDSNSHCLSGHCGVSGTGHCCIGSCSTSDTQGCAASDCDTTGACFYPLPGAFCGPQQSCTGQTQTNPGTCDGRGTCRPPMPPTTACDPFLCSGASCATQCSGSADCASTAFCDWNGQDAGVCCPAYVYDTIQVDTLGLDRPCCGAGTGPSACRTIARAVSLAGATGLAQSTVTVTNSNGGGDWSGDHYPIQLSYGIDLKAPGIYFSTTPADTNAIFQVSQFNGDNSSGVVTIEGQGNLPIQVGIDSHRLVGGSNTGIVVAGPMTLKLVNANVVISPRFGCGVPCFYGAILVSAGGTLTLGAETSNPTTVTIGAPGIPYAGSNGILCEGGPGLPATVNDLPSPGGTPSLQILNQKVGIAAMQNCNLNLSANPQIGAGFDDAGSCLDLSMALGLQASGAMVRLSNARVQCCAGDGIDSKSSNLGGDSNQIRANGGVGLRCIGGTCRPTYTTVAHNGVGVSAEDDSLSGAAMVDLSGGNHIGCNLRGNGNSPGMNVINRTTALLDARNLAWARWDSSVGATEIWTCDPLLQSCTCSGASTCPGGIRPLPDGADAVVVGAVPGLIDDSLGSLAASCP